MTNLFLGLTLGLTAIAASITPSQARNLCADRDVVITRLASKFGETPRAMGLAANQGIVEIHASEVSGSWTITVTTPNGRTCMLASGLAFEDLRGDPPGKSGKPT